MLLAAMSNEETSAAAEESSIDVAPLETSSCFKLRNVTILPTSETSAIRPSDMAARSAKYPDSCNMAASDAATTALIRSEPFSKE